MKEKIINKIKTISPQIQKIIVNIKLKMFTGLYLLNKISLINIFY